MESYERAIATYGAVAFRGGVLRDIMVTPDTAKEDGPVVYLLQGYCRATMEGPNAARPYRARAQGLADRGIATYRVEKPGMGDSQGGLSCFGMDFDNELSAFRERLRTLINTYGVVPSRIVLLGHSMGGVEAPVLAAETPGLRGLGCLRRRDAQLA
jgi:alpha-beta hydrolase superfamily lysophospholipase